MKNLKNYVALITGSSSGIGFEMAKILLENSATVIISARTEKKLKNSYNMLKEKNFDVYSVALDVCDEKSVENAVKFVEKNFGKLDMLVNNAGIGSNAPGMENLPQNYNFFDIPLQTVKKIIDTNFIGFFLVTSKFAPIMIKNHRGSIIYVSTSNETMTRQGQLPYGPSKAGAEAMAKIIAEEMKNFGINVNIICPGGFTDTGMAGVGVKEYFQKNNLEILPPTVLNKVILYLASEKSAGITGQKFIGKYF